MKEHFAPFASDIHGVWKDEVGAAEQSIWIFTPYFDDLLVNLLRTVSLRASDLTVITDLSPESGTLGYRKQLQATLKLLDSGVRVLNLPRLHAKVLVVDETRYVLGSQNFTRYARRSKEVSAFVRERGTRDRVVTTLRGWRNSASPVDKDFISELLRQLEVPFVQLQEKFNLLQDAYEEVVGAWEAKAEARAANERLKAEQVLRRSQLRSRIAKSVRNSRYRQAHTAAIARLEDIEREDGSLYESLRVHGDADLTRWWDQPREREVKLVRTRFYPILLAAQGRLAYARVTKTRISYVKSGVDYTEMKQVGGATARVRLIMPRDPADANLEIRMRPQYAVTDWTLALALDGSSVEVVRDAVVGAPDRATQQLRSAVLEQLESSDGAVAFVSRLLASIKYSQVGIENPNARSLFPDGWHRVTMTQFGTTELLIASPHP